MESITGPLQIDYIQLYNCQFHGYESVYTFLLILWVVFLTNLLGNTASNYFSPTLAAICSKLSLSPDVAGVTFLAFGNGAPDVFSSITSFSGSGNVLIGIGSLLGGSVFVTTIVVGTVAILCPCKISGTSFTRDILFYLIVASILMYAVVTGEVRLWLALSLFAVYGVYALIVVYSSWIDSNSRKLLEASRPVASRPQLQTAFWYQSAAVPAPPTSHAAPTLPSETAPGGYKFLILDEFGEEKSESDSEEDDGERDAVINLSGSLLSVTFGAPIIEDYFSKTSRYRLSREKNRVEAFSIGSDPSDVESPLSSGSLTESLLGDRPTPVTPLPSNLRLQSTKYSMMASSLYWQNYYLQRRLRRSLLAADWWTFPWYVKILAVIEFPVVIARDITIASVDEEMWSKSLAVVQPIAAPLFLLFLSGEFHAEVWKIPMWLVCFLFSLVPAAIVFLTTHNSYPPKNLFFGTLWAIFAFSLCIGWIYLLASELVSCLSAAGAIFKIPPVFLGLTVLAWGNSIGDFFANMSVAKRGHGQMAIAGCYGGPIFDILVGLGFALTYSCYQTYPEPFKLSFDISSLISLIFLFISLLSTLITVTVRGYQIESWFGYGLFGLYVVHMLTQAIIVLTQ